MLKFKRDIENACVFCIKILKYPLIFLEGFCLINIVILLISNSSNIHEDLYSLLNLMIIFFFASIGIIALFLLYVIVIHAIGVIYEKIRNYIYFLNIGGNGDIYLRDIPKNYSPAIVSLLFDKNIEPYRDFPAVILNLKLRGYIDIINNNGIIEYIKLKSEDSNLLEHEKFVYHAILTDKIIYKGAFRGLIKSDAADLGLISLTGDSFKLTSLGITDMREWKNFRKFLNHFTLMKDKNIDDLILYDKFLVYSIVLNNVNKIESLSLNSKLYNQYDLLSYEYKK
jgi:hypothetical protein